MARQRDIWRLRVDGAHAAFVVFILGAGVQVTPTAEMQRQLAAREIVGPVRGDDFLDNGQVVQNELFVPAPRGAGESLDESANRPPGVPDMVTTLEGDRLTGKVLDSDNEKLRLAGPHYEGEALVLVSALDTINLRTAAGPSDAGRDEVLLTNGDRAMGETVAITPEYVLVQSPVAGAVKISRLVVRSISFSKGRTVLLESRFENGEMAPWTVLGGDWAVGDGGLVSGGGGSNTRISAQVDQKDAVTFEAEVEGQQGQGIYLYAVLFADSTENRYGQRSVFCRFGEHDFAIGQQSPQRGENHIIGSGYNNLGSSFINRTTKGTLRFAYDPKTGSAIAWLNSTELGRCNVPEPPQLGQFVILVSRYPARISHIRMHRGIVPPSEEADEAMKTSDAVTFTNHDRISAADVAMADGTLLVSTEHGELAYPVDKIDRIIFRTDGREEPRRHKGDVTVTAGDSRFTFRFEKLAADHVQGSSECFGEISVRRDATQEIRFNIYR